VVRVQDGFLHNGGFTLVAIATAVTILALVDHDEWIVTRVLALPVLRTVGVVSYGVYLWHLPVFFAVNRQASSWPAAAQAMLALAVTAACTAASWRFVEQPFLRMKARSRPAKVGAIAAR
jgi:peptidoglycan/LPS O-acetylase OafA/YrhL